MGLRLELEPDQLVGERAGPALEVEILGGQAVHGSTTSLID